MNGTTVDRMLQAYLECALWSSHDDTTGYPLDDAYGVDEIAPESVTAARDECAAFLESAGEDVDGLEPEQVGHDFWLTRNGHGAGFWDRGLGDVGKRLTALCKPFGGVDCYVGDDGRVYFS